jgi:cyclopropane-fatty-acyl-phospholipid synthase
MVSTQQLISELLNQAGIVINGNNPWDITINNDAIFQRVVKENALGLGEAYMDGWWDCSHLDQFFFRLLTAKLDAHLRKHIFQQKEFFVYSLKQLARVATNRVYNYQSKARAFAVGEAHYDAGNDLFKAMLDKELNYTCGYWKKADNLDLAQEYKLKLVCDKLQLKSGQRVLDIGCGWGALARYAAKNYGVSVVGITISKEQKEFAEQLTLDLPVEIRLQDYRDVSEQFDHIVSLGMFEHVGHKNYRAYMKIVSNCLKDEGLFLLHTIGGNTTSYQANNWIRKYIFPNGMIPSIQQIGRAIERIFVMEDWHNFGAYYDKTLMAWQSNFERNWTRLKANYSERFYRMWNYYLLSCAGAFRARNLQLWQIVLSKPGLVGGYSSLR